MISTGQLSWPRIRRGSRVYPVAAIVAFCFGTACDSDLFGGDVGVSDGTVGVTYIASMAIHVDHVAELGIDNVRQDLKAALETMNGRFCQQTPTDPPGIDVQCDVRIVLSEQDRIFGEHGDGLEQLTTINEAEQRTLGQDGIDATFIMHRGTIPTRVGPAEGTTPAHGGVRSVINFETLGRMPSTPHHEFGHQAGWTRHPPAHECFGGAGYMCRGRGTEEIVTETQCNWIKLFRSRTWFREEVTDALAPWGCGL